MEYITARAHPTPKAKPRKNPTTAAEEKVTCFRMAHHFALAGPFRSFRPPGGAELITLPWLVRRAFPLGGPLAPSWRGLSFAEDTCGRYSTSAGGAARNGRVLPTPFRSRDFSFSHSNPLTCRSFPRMGYTSGAERPACP